MNDQPAERHHINDEFVDIEVDAEEQPGQVWQKINNQLVEGADSVEVMPAPDGEGFILRSWWDIQEDNSNREDAEDTND